jgi:tetratricopeptide (TPR) repeat protein
MVDTAREELERTLAPLQLAEFIYELPAVGDVEYTFKHPLTHEAAYNSVLIERRKVLHERVAQAIEELGANNLDDHLVDLAHHYGRSGNRTKAVDYLTRAGIQIAQRSASQEAIQQHFETALAILREMPEGRSRDLHELQLQIAIGHTAFMYQGDGSADAGKALARAVELAVAPEDTPQKVVALSLLGYHHLACAEPRRASEVSRALYEIAQTGQPQLESVANQLMGIVALQMGEFRKAEQFLGASLERASRADIAILSISLVRKGSALWNLGFPDQALALAREGVTVVEHADDRFLHAVVLLFAGITHMRCGELVLAEDLFRKSLNVCTERGFRAASAANTIFMGTVSALRGQAQAGLEQLRRGAELLTANTATSWQEPQLYIGGYNLALGYELAGRPDEALATLIPALGWMERRGAEVDLAPMHLLKGWLFESKSNSSEAENSFRTSIEIARRQNAKSLELRATTSLARLLAKQGRSDEARAMLSEIYGWFTEGFDTADLKEAKALLDELSNLPQ